MQCTVSRQGTLDKTYLIKAIYYFVRTYVYINYNKIIWQKIITIVVVPNILVLNSLVGNKMYVCDLIIFNNTFFIIFVYWIVYSLLFQWYHYFSAIYSIDFVLRSHCVILVSIQFTMNEKISFHDTLQLLKLFSVFIIIYNIAINI